MVDTYAQWKNEEKKAKRYPSDDDYDFEEEEEIKEPKGQGLPSTS
jgi:hypothetical protein